jgi:hypothetical protein
MEKYENFGRVQWSWELRIDAIVCGGRYLLTFMLMFPVVASLEIVSTNRTRLLHGVSEALYYS